MSILAKLPFWPTAILLGTSLILLVYGLFQSKIKKDAKYIIILAIITDILLLFYKASNTFAVLSNYKPIIVILNLISGTIFFAILFLLGIKNIKRGSIQFQILIVVGVLMVICIGLLFISLYLRDYYQ